MLTLTTAQNWSQRIKWNRVWIFQNVLFLDRGNKEFKMKKALEDISLRGKMEPPSTLIQFQRGVQISAQGGQIERFPVLQNIMLTNQIVSYWRKFRPAFLPNTSPWMLRSGGCLCIITLHVRSDVLLLFYKSQ